MVDTAHTVIIDTLKYVIHNGTVMHKPLIDAGELFYNIVGTRDLITMLSGLFYAGLGMVLSLLVPDAKIPDAFKSVVINSKWRRVLSGIIVTWFCLYLFGFGIADSSMKAFVTVCIGIGFLNYHLTNVIINITTSAFSRVALMSNRTPDNTTKP